jgi:hypothetical protein
VKEIVLADIDPHLPRVARDDPRHFWHNDRIRRNDTLLSDLAVGTDIIALELRPDCFSASIPGEEDALVAYNPEETPAGFIRMIFPGRHGGPCCYEVRPEDQSPLDPNKDFLSQDIVPEASVVVRHRTVYYVWSATVLIGAALLGLLAGYLTSGMSW